MGAIHLASANIRAAHFLHYSALSGVAVALAACVPAPSWGAILADRRAFILRYPHISIFPGVMIVISVLAFNFVGDGLCDALDPKE